MTDPTPLGDAQDLAEDRARMFRDFLSGVGPLDGKWFGERDASGHVFWWRDHLDVLDALIEQSRTNEARITAWNTRADALEARRGDGGDLREQIATLNALRLAHHALTTTHNLRASDLYVEDFEAQIANGVPRDRMEWFIDHSRELEAIDAILSAVQAGGGPELPGQGDGERPELPSGDAGPTARAAPEAEPSGWRNFLAAPASRRKIVALYNDGSGANLFYVTDFGELIDSDGESANNLDDGGYGLWAYIPDAHRLWCEWRADEPMILPSAESGASAHAEERDSSREAKQPPPLEQPDPIGVAMEALRRANEQITHLTRERDKLRRLLSTPTTGA